MPRYRVPEWAKPASRPEASSYLNAIYEHTFAERHPTSEAVSFLRPPFDLGFLLYASDTP
jgi:hypothetical protein